MSRERKFLNMADWRAVKAAGGDPGVKPINDHLYQPTGALAPPVPVHLPISMSLHGDQAQRDRQRALAANRALEKAGLREHW